MRILMSIFLASLLLTSAARLGVAQQPLSVLTKIEAAVKETQPTWRLLKKNITKDGQYVAYEWKVGKSSIELLLVFTSSKDLAIDRFKTLPMDLELNGLPMKFAETQLPLGDEALSWSHLLDHRVSGILLRKGRVVANISGKNKETVSRFASQVAEILPQEKS